MAEVSRLQPQFPTLERQREADHFGMLIFLATEVLIFGGLFAALFVLRAEHSTEYTKASKEMHYWLGGINTAVLLTSSALVALMVEAVKAGSARLAKYLLFGALALGLTFLAIKFMEYGLEYRDGVVPQLSAAKLRGGPHALFMDLYFAATGLHALHVLGGLTLLASLIWPFGTARRDTSAVFAGNAALYWHLVDVIWVFLYPTLYLAR
uniref:cytochrome c oxidase subunit 3 n=1 Tax=Altererythrobacter segetis TaxID=1104773 RepID=UPI0014092E2C|nr:cytochrome c oxidase subunit 3 [Altererythrobacter segetis]